MHKKVLFLWKRSNKRNEERLEIHDSFAYGFQIHAFILYAFVTALLLIDILHPSQSDLFDLGNIYQNPSPK